MEDTMKINGIFMRIIETALESALKKQGINVKIRCKGVEAALTGNVIGFDISHVSAEMEKDDLMNLVKGKLFGDEGQARE